MGLLTVRCCLPNTLKLDLIVQPKIPAVLEAEGRCSELKTSLGNRANPSPTLTTY